MFIPLASQTISNGWKFVEHEVISTVPETLFQIAGKCFWSLLKEDSYLTKTIVTFVYDIKYNLYENKKNNLNLVFIKYRSRSTHVKNILYFYVTNIQEVEFLPICSDEIGQIFQKN